jgi:hypothetical protein
MVARTPAAISLKSKPFRALSKSPRLKIAFSLSFSLGFVFFDTFRPFELCIHEPAHDFVSGVASSFRGNNGSGICSGWFMARMTRSFLFTAAIVDRAALMANSDAG